MKMKAWFWGVRRRERMREISSLERTAGSFLARGELGGRPCEHAKRKAGVERQVNLRMVAC